VNVDGVHLVDLSSGVVLPAGDKLSVDTDVVDEDTNGLIWKNKEVRSKESRGLNRRNRTLEGVHDLGDSVVDIESITNDDFGLNTRVSLDLLGEFEEFLLGASTDEDVEALLGKSLSEGLADALRGTGDDGPTTGLGTPPEEINKENRERGLGKKQMVIC